jgi:Fe2+ transport system protein FeoA
MNHVHPLSELKTGQTAVIQDLQGGYSFRSRLAALGFTPGVEITMVQNLGHGPMIVTLRDTRIALGRGEAEKILIQLQREEEWSREKASQSA